VDYGAFESGAIINAVAARLIHPTQTGMRVLFAGAFYLANDM
jgi:hypothetical protein